MSDDDKKLLVSVDSDNIVKEFKNISSRKVIFSGKNRAFKAAMAIDSLGKVNFLLDIFDKAPVDWKTAICDELSLFHDPRSIAALSDILLTAKNPNVRYAAAEALSQVGDATAIPALESAAQLSPSVSLHYSMSAWIRHRTENGERIDRQRLIKYHIQNLHLYTIFQNLPLEKPKKYAIVIARFGFHESPRMLCPLQAHSRELIVNPKPPFGYWFQEWIEVDPKEHGER